LRSLTRPTAIPVKVTSQVEDNYGEGRAARDFHIEEGPLSRCASSTSWRRLRAPVGDTRILNTSPASPCRATIAEDREVVLNNYFNRGFAGCRWKHGTLRDDAKTQMDVTFEINEGRPARQPGAGQ